MRKNAKQQEFDDALEALFRAWSSHSHETDRRLVNAIIDPMARLGRAHADIKHGT